MASAPASKLPPEYTQDACCDPALLAEVVPLQAQLAHSPNANYHRLDDLGDEQLARMVRTPTAASQMLPECVRRGMQAVDREFGGDIRVALAGGAALALLTHPDPALELQLGHLDFDLVLFCANPGVAVADHQDVMRRAVAAFGGGCMLDTSQGLVMRSTVPDRPQVVTLKFPRPREHAEAAAEAAAGPPRARRSGADEDRALQAEREWWSSACQHDDDDDIVVLAVQFLPYWNPHGLKQALCAFDISACRVAITADGLFFGTPSFCHALSSGIVLVEGCRLHPNYAKRLAKYLHLKNFGVALPLAAGFELLFRNNEAGINLAEVVGWVCDQERLAAQSTGSLGAVVGSYGSVPRWVWWVPSDKWVEQVCDVWTAWSMVWWWSGSGSGSGALPKAVAATLEAPHPGAVHLDAEQHRRVEDLFPYRTPRPRKAPAAYAGASPHDERPSKRQRTTAGDAAGGATDAAGGTTDAAATSAFVMLPGLDEFTATNAVEEGVVVLPRI